MSTWARADEPFARDQPRPIVDRYATIRSHIRVTPRVQIDATDFGLADFSVTFKLEHMQYAG